MKKKTVLFSILLMFLGWSAILDASAQKRTVTGKVTDAETGELLPGVTVRIKGTMQGTVTLSNGTFTLEEGTSSDVLVFSFIGYKSKEVPIENNSIINVALGYDVLGLEEVVVIGYGQIKKEDATGSLVAVSVDDFNQGAISSPQDLLIGKTSGVQITPGSGAPGSKATIRIRGGASMSASNEPLFVIDGVPVESDDINGISNPLATINPDDIETFTVLKDASSTAIYGSRASNGVIIITTKKGKEGQPFSVSYSGEFSVSTANKRLDVYDAEGYKAMVEDLYGAGSVQAQALGDANTDWQDEIYSAAIGTDHNLSFSGGLKSLPYRLSLGFNSQDGVLKTSNIERKSVNLNLTPQFFDNHLKASLSAKGSLVNNTFANEDAIGSAIGFDPTHPVYSGNNEWGGYWQWIGTNGIPLQFTPDNPVSLLNQRDDQSDVYRAIVNLSLDYKLHFFPDLSAVVNVGFDISDSDGERYVSPDASWMYQNEEIKGEMHLYDQRKENKLLDSYLKYFST